MLSLEQAAAYLGYSPSGLRKLVQRTRERKHGRTIKFFQSGKWSNIKFKQEWLDEFIEQGTVEPVPTKPKKRVSNAEVERIFGSSVRGLLE